VRRLETFVWRITHRISPLDGDSTARLRVPRAQARACRWEGQARATTIAVDPSDPNAVQFQMRCRLTLFASASWFARRCPPRDLQTASVIPTRLAGYQRALAPETTISSIMFFDSRSGAVHPSSYAYYGVARTTDTPVPEPASLAR
jgi:uncharacterized protein (DUF3084 family)